MGDADKCKKTPKNPVKILGVQSEKLMCLMFEATSVYHNFGKQSSQKRFSDYVWTQPT